MRHESNVSLQGRVRAARFEHALLRWESAVLIGLTILAVPAALIAGGFGMLPGWSWIPCLLFGLSAEGALVYASTTDPESNRRVVAALLQSHHGSEKLRDDAVRQHVIQAFDYRARIEAVLLGRGGSPARSALDQTVVQIDGWLSNICKLAERLDLFQGEAGFQTADKPRLQARIEELSEKAQTSTDAKVQRKVRETLASRKHQLRTIEELERAIERGQLQLEHAVAALGAICAQTVLFCAQGVDAGAAHQLNQDISEEAQQVDDILSAMERAYDMDIDEPTNLKTTLHGLGCSKGVEQLGQLEHKHENLRWILEQRLNAGELTFKRYLEAAEQVHLSVLDNLHEVTIALRSVSAIDSEYINGRLGKIRGSVSANDPHSAEKASLEQRSLLIEQQNERVARFLAENESAMTVLDKTAAAFAVTKTGTGRAALEIEETVKALETLAKRAHKYGR